jgi:hypothetical protein
MSFLDRWLAWVGMGCHVARERLGTFHKHSVDQFRSYHNHSNQKTGYQKYSTIYLWLSQETRLYLTDHRFLAENNNHIWEEKPHSAPFQAE